MNKLIKLLGVSLLVLIIAGVAYGFQTGRAFNYGEADVEWTMGVVKGDSTVVVGDWVSVAYSDTQSCDTTAVVVRCAVENSGSVIGVVDSLGSLDGGAGDYVRIVTRGIVSAKVNGVDSGSAEGIVNGTPLASSAMPGAAGAASTYITVAGSGASATGGANAVLDEIQASRTRIIGYALGSVATTDTGHYNLYDVYVVGR